MSIERLVGVLAEELAATEQRTYYEYGKKDKPGTFVYSKEFPSHPTRLKAVKMGLELHNAFPDKEIGVKHSADEALISYVGQAMRANEDSDSD